MDDDQRKIYELVKSNDDIILIVSGPPGSGKSKALESICRDLKTMCVAYTNELVKNLPGHMNCTLHKAFFFKVSPPLRSLDMSDVLKLAKMILMQLSGCVWKSGSTLINDDYCVLVIEEVSMIPLWMVIHMTQVAITMGVRRIVLVGDKNQVHPVGMENNIFTSKHWRMVFSQTKTIRLTSNYRFDDDMKILVRNLKKILHSKSISNKHFIRYIVRNLPPTVVISTKPPTDLHKNHVILSYMHKFAQEYKFSFEQTIHVECPFPLTKNMELCIEKLCNREIICQLNLSYKCNIRQTTGTKYFGTFISIQDSETMLLDNLIKIEKKIYHINWHDFYDMCNFQSKTLLKKFSFETFTVKQFPVKLQNIHTIHSVQGQTLDNENIIIDLRGMPNKNVTYTAYSRLKSLKQLTHFVINKTCLV